MRPKLIHQQAMNLSFRAKQAMAENNYLAAYESYRAAAELESSVAEFYFDKPDLEPTRSVIIRSAAFLNLKAGCIDEAQKFIFFGLLNLEDVQIKEQLNNALELAVSLRNLNPQNASKEFFYINLLRQRSVQYSIEPTDDVFGRSVSLEMLKDFAESYLKSLKAFAITRYRSVFSSVREIGDGLGRAIDQIVNPLITQTSYGSFKFSIANDYLERPGEERELVLFKASIVPIYHDEIFINPLTPEGIDEIKKKYDNEEIGRIFKPLFRIKSNNTPYRIGYIDSENLNKTYVNTIINKQRKQLITATGISEEDIGFLEDSVVHKRLTGGRISRETIISEQLKSFSRELKTRVIEPSNLPPVILNDEIVITITFDSDVGFSFSFDDIQIKHTSNEYHKGLKEFYSKFYDYASFLNKNWRTLGVKEIKDYEVISRLIGNLEAL